jgi:hypothetical protein
VESLRGNDTQVFERAGQLATEIQALDLSGEPNGRSVRDSSVFRNNLLRNVLGVRTLTGLRLGRYGEAEQAARQRIDLPPNPYSDVDPREEVSRARVMLAHTLAGQGRRDEAKEILDGEVPRYLDEQSRGAQGLDFWRDLAYAQYVDAIVRPAGDPRRASGLAAARRTLDGVPAEARQLLDIRELSQRIAAAG